ncbi:MAG: protein kinase family protein, partial [Leptolyngbya sp.]|nr:protein kinase family protein [Leptolyngbya sp.]
MSGKNRLLGGRYQFIQVLGTGHQSQTLLVADVHYPGHPKCVVKQLPLPTRNPTTLKFILSLLRKKIEVLEMLGRDDRIPDTFGFFEDQQSFYLVQEFVPGRSLSDELAPGEPWPQVKLVAFLREMLQILAFLQEHGVTHGNLKPTNIIRHQADRRLVLCDFNLLKDLGREVLGRELAEQGRLKQSWVYVAPEQRLGRPRFCTDHYALGIVAIQAATGLPMDKLPDAEDPDVHRKLTTVLQNAADISINLASLIARMVHPDGDRRHQKAVELLADLHRLTVPGSQQPLPLVDETIAFPTPESATTDPQAGKRSLGLSLGTRGRWVAMVIGAAIATLIGLWVFRVPQRVWAQRYLQTAETAQASGDTQAALDQYNRVLELLPQHAPALAARGTLFNQLGETEAALQDLTAALDQEPDQGEWLYQRGNVRFRAGDIEGAIKDYTQALDVDSTLVNAYMNRGSARAEWGDDQGAVQDYTQALALTPESDTQAAAYVN